MPVGRLVESRGNHFGVHASSHIRNLFRTLVDEKHNDVSVGMVLCDGVCYIFKQYGLAGLGRSHDQCTLSFAYRREHIDHARGDAVVGTLCEVEFLFREKRHKMFEWFAVAYVLRIKSVDRRYVAEGEILLTFAGRTYASFHHVSGL